MEMLVMGFEPFGDNKINPSENYAKYFKNHLILPVNNKIESIVNNLNIENYEIILMLGLSPMAKTFQLELVGRNKRAKMKNHNNKEEGEGEEKIENDKSDLLTTTLDIGSFRMLPSRVMWSIDAGDYYCNELYYRMLIKGQFANSRIVFCHVPPFESIPFEEGIEIIDEIIKKINY